MKTKKTEIISFRVPAEIVIQVDRQAKKEKKRRSAFVEALFLPALEARISKPEKIAA